MSTGQHGAFEHYNILSLKICSWKLLCVHAGKEFIHSHDKACDPKEENRKGSRKKGGRVEGTGISFQETSEGGLDKLSSSWFNP